jgi:succinate-semialdehyde dehydrogenase/glutarate-semialdehyde dehydrogenase
MSYQSINPNSGYGRESGNMGIQEFVNKKLVRMGHFAAPV